MLLCELTGAITSRDLGECPRIGGAVIDYGTPIVKVAMALFPCGLKCVFASLLERFVQGLSGSELNQS